MTDQTLFAVVALFLAILALLTMEGCSGDATRGKADLGPSMPMGRDAERDRIIGQGKDFCVKFQDDVACRGPKK